MDKSSGFGRQCSKEKSGDGLLRSARAPFECAKKLVAFALPILTKLQGSFGSPILVPWLKPPVE
jgi:hypothetical protein